MFERRTRLAASVVAIGLALSACTSTVTDPGGGAAAMGATSANTGGTSATTGGKGGSVGVNVGGTSSGGASSGGSSSGGSGDATSTGGGGSTSGASGTSGVSGSSGTSSNPGDPVYLPAGIRRLTNEEYRASVQALFTNDSGALTVTLPTDFAFPPDSRQDGFTRNQTQRVDPVMVKQLDANAQTIADAARPTLATMPSLAGCAKQDDACAKAFIADFGARAYRRALEADEPDDLFTLYKAGATGGTFEDGIALVIRGVLQSAGFIYITELGDGSAASGADFELTPREIATSLAYYMTAAPPSAALLADADSGTVTVGAGDADFHVADAVGTEYDFGTPEAMGIWARRLLYAPSGVAQAAVVRMVKEWIGVDRILDTGKDMTAYPNFTDAYRSSLDTQTLSFVRYVTSNDQGEQGVAELLGGNLVPLNDTLAAAYGLGAPPTAKKDPFGFAPMTVPDSRRGILNQGAFLSVFAHASESAPVLRGVAVMKRILCSDPGSPADLSDVKPPAQPNDNQTTRDRYAMHSTDAKCAGCHAPIDAIGFTFEDFDGSGAYRTTEGKNALPIDSKTTVDADSTVPALPISGDMNDSGDLAVALAASPGVLACFARHLFRNAATQSGTAVQASEDSFVAAWKADAAASTGQITSSILSYATSPILSHRRAP